MSDKYSFNEYGVPQSTWEDLYPNTAQNTVKSKATKPKKKRYIRKYRGVGKSTSEDKTEAAHNKAKELAPKNKPAKLQYDKSSYKPKQKAKPDRARILSDKEANEMFLLNKKHGNGKDLFGKIEIALIGANANTQG